MCARSLRLSATFYGLSFLCFLLNVKAGEGSALGIVIDCNIIYGVGYRIVLGIQCVCDSVLDCNRAITVGPCAPRKIYCAGGGSSRV